MMSKSITSGELLFASLLEKYFLSYMINQKKSSVRTIATYRDSFRLYIEFLLLEYYIAPENIEMSHLQLEYLVAFGNHLENDRGCKAVTINLRMSALKSFLKYAAVEAPEYSGLIRKSLTLPNRKFDKTVMTFITKQEYESLLSVCDSSSKIDIRDKAMLMIMYNTGCRVSELVALKASDAMSLTDAGTAYLRFYGKGRKERLTPIWKSTAQYLLNYINTQGISADEHIFRGKLNEDLTRSGVGQRISVIVQRASDNCPSLCDKTITPHIFRHSAAMNLLQAGVDISTIAIWLGHESIETTHKYMVADIEIMRKAMEKMEETDNSTYCYTPSSGLLEFLKLL